MGQMVSLEMSHGRQSHAVDSAPRDKLFLPNLVQSVGSTNTEFSALHDEQSVTVLTNRNTVIADAIQIKKQSLQVIAGIWPWYRVSRAKRCKSSSSECNTKTQNVCMYTCNIYLSACWTQAVLVGSDAMPTESAYLYSTQHNTTHKASFDCNKQNGDLR